VTKVPLIELRHIGKTYGGITPTHVLHDVSLTIEAGEFVAIVGASGSGKSTLMNILGCLDRASSGSFRIAGREVNTCSPEQLARLRRELFGFVFQQYHLVGGLSAAENVEVPAIYRGMSKTKRMERVLTLLGKLGLAQRAHHLPQQLSGGQQQRVSIARALMNGGRVLLADEPTGALDTASGHDVIALLQELAASGHTVILVTHDRTVAAAAQRMIEISDGRVVADSGRKSEPQHHITAVDGGDNLRMRALNGGIFDAVRAALRALTVNLVRSLLTVLGIVMGVASVVALLAIGEGTRRSVISGLEVFGTHRLYISPVADVDSRLNGGLIASDIEIVKRVSGVDVAMPYLEGSVMVRVGRVDHRTTGTSVTHEFPRILKWKLERGSFFTERDETNYACVAVLGKKLAARLFAPRIDPVRKYILIDDVPFLVLGVLEGKGALAGNTDNDDIVVLPFSTGSKRIFGSPNLTWISVAMRDSDHTQQIVDDITRRLTHAHRIKDFNIFNMAALVAARKATMNVMTGLLLLTAIISLIVGGIGVMNVMLMTVTERTSEIGIRMAVGARRSDVLAQFLTEALVLASLGGVVGLAVGHGAARLITLFDTPVIFTPWASVLAFGSAVVTGLVCGYLPARRAAGLDPVAALARR